jgi:hypothetical protein
MIRFAGKSPAMFDQLPDRLVWRYGAMFFRISTKTDVPAESG